MSIANLQQNIPVGQYTIYNYPMRNYNADAFAEWLTEAFEKSSYKSFAALADASKLSRSNVSKLAGAKDQSLTDKPSQPKPETVIRLAKALNEDVDKALLLAGHAPLNNNTETHEIISGVRIQLDRSVKLSEANKQKILDTVRFITEGVVATENRQ